MLNDQDQDKLNFLLWPVNKYSKEINIHNKEDSLRKNVEITDAYIPQSAPTKVEFVDTNKDENTISGDIIIESNADKDDTIEEFVLYFGKSSKTRIKSDDNKIGTVSVKENKKTIYTVYDKTIPY